MSAIILGIESSCDDTSAAVIKDGYLLSNVVSSQAVHEAYGGVVPELASRAHQQNIVPVVHEALKRAGVTKEELSAVAFTRGPGLMGSLLVGVSFAKGFARSLGIPLIDVNHLTGHVLAHFIKAVDKKIITENSRLFHHVYTGVKNDIKRALEVEEINKLLNEVPLKKLPEDLIRCRVWANLMFQLRGMPFVDLAHLHKSDLKGNTLSYRRYKTGGQMIVDIPITAMKLINKYQNTNQDSPYLFPILSGTKTGEDLYTEYQQALRTMNYNLGRLAKKCGVATKVSSYTTRHTWATLAKYCNFSEQLICEAFGHSSVKVTETYLKNFKNEEIKKANDAIILYVSNNGKKRV